MSASSRQGYDIAQVRAEAEAAVGARLRADATAVSRAILLAHGFSARAGLDPAAASRLALVIEEWVANVVEHGEVGEGGRIGLRLRLQDGAVRLSVSDGGQPFDPTAAAFDGPNHERGGGAGLALIADLCRIARYQRRAGRNRLILEIPLSAGAPQ